MGWATLDFLAEDELQRRGRRLAIVASSGSERPQKRAPRRPGRGF
jgi:hypothetical protein